MKQVQNIIKRHSLVVGVILMFALTWPQDLANTGVIPLELPFIVYILLGWGFIVASLIMTGITLGKDEVIKLLKRYLHWRVALKWYLVAFFLEASLVAGGVYLNAWLTDVQPDFGSVIARKLFGESAFLPLYILPFFLVEIITNGEEIGWRGYILPRLQAKYNALTSTLILGVVWGFWHLPKFLNHWNTAQFMWFMVHIMAFAIVLTWLYNSTGGSLLLVAILHATSNTAGAFLPMANAISDEYLGTYIIYVLLEVLAAFVVILYAGPKTLSKTNSMEVQYKADGI